MTLWMVRAGRYGERQDLALDQDVVAIGWPELHDLSQVGTRENLRSLVMATYPSEKQGRLHNWVGQLWAFVDKMQAGDLVCMPLKGRSAIAIGRIRSVYRFRDDLPPESRHTRDVEWVRKDVPRSAFEQDLLYSLGALGTICAIRRNNAEARVQAMLSADDDPGIGRGPLPLETGDEEESMPADLETYARDQIVAYIGRHCKGHRLAHLIAVLLEAQGYTVLTSPEGPDAGVDILAGQGAMGFDLPRLCVQVKSGDQALSVGVLRELQGVMRNFGAEQGLLVSWGGFRDSVRHEARALFFHIRLWDSGDLVEVLLAHYDRLPDDVQAELPLKRIWTLVQEEE